MWRRLVALVSMQCTYRAYCAVSGVMAMLALEAGLLSDRGEQKRAEQDRCCSRKLFYFEHPHPLWVEILWGWALQRPSGVGPSRATLALGIQGQFGVGHSRDTLARVERGTHWGWGHCRDTLENTAKRHTYFTGHSRDTCGDKLSGVWGGWAL